MKEYNNKNNLSRFTTNLHFHRHFLSKIFAKKKSLLFIATCLSCAVNAETFIVNNSANEGDGSFRAALTSAAVSSDTSNQVIFSQALANSTIQLESPLDYESANDLTITGLRQLTINAPIDDALLSIRSDSNPTIRLQQLHLTESANQTSLPTQDFLLDIETLAGAFHFEQCLVQGHPSAFNKRGIINVKINGQESVFSLNITDTAINTGSYTGHLVNATANNDLGLLKAEITNSHFSELTAQDGLINLVAERGTAQLKLTTNSTIQATTTQGALLSLSGDIEDSAVDQSDFNTLTFKDVAITNNTARNIFSINNNRGRTNTQLQNITINQNALQFAAETASKDHQIEANNISFSDNELNEAGFNFNDDNLQGEIIASQLNNNSVGSSPELATKKAILNFSPKSLSNLTLDALSIMNNEMAGIKFYNFNAINTQILNSTIANNDNSLPAAKPETNSLSGDNYGGGLFFSSGGDASYQVTNTTISGNKAVVGGGIIIVNKAKLTLASSTIVNNSALEGAGLVSTKTYDTSGEKPGNDFQIVNSIISGNTAVNLNTGGDLLGEFSISHTLISELNNFPGDTTKINGTPVQQLTESASNLLNQDPLLAPLGDNSGNTSTHALNQNSPAIGAGNTNAADLPNNDQRGAGFLRVSNGRLDLGAIQFDGIVAERPEPEPPEDNNTNDPDSEVGEEPQVDRSLGNGSEKGPNSGSLGWLLLLTLLPINIRRASLEHGVS